jgi:signal transduction histidine kinase
MLRLKRAEDELRAARDELEQRVAARTIELGQAVAQLRAEVTDRLQAEESLRALAARVAEAEEMERRRIARELHDQVGQNLSALNINLNIVLTTLPGNVPASLPPRLHDSLALVQETVDRIRDVMADLRPAVLDDYGLWAALQWYSQRFQRYTQVPITLTGQEIQPRLPPAAETAMFRVAQEALTNAAKHAHAHHIAITLTQAERLVRLLIADDGIGFDFDALPGPGERSGWGLLMMRERMQAVGGHLHIAAAPGQGARVLVELPQ